MSVVSTGVYPAAMTPYSGHWLSVDRVQVWHHFDSHAARSSVSPPRNSPLTASDHMAPIGRIMTSTRLGCHLVAVGTGCRRTGLVLLPGSARI